MVRLYGNVWHDMKKVRNLQGRQVYYKALSMLCEKSQNCDIHEQESLLHCYVVSITQNRFCKSVDQSLCCQ